MMYGSPGCPKWKFPPLHSKKSRIGKKLALKWTKTLANLHIYVPVYSAHMTCRSVDDTTEAPDPCRTTGSHHTNPSPGNHSPRTSRQGSDHHWILPAHHSGGPRYTSLPRLLLEMRLLHPIPTSNQVVNTTSSSQIRSGMKHFYKSHTQNIEAKKLVKNLSESQVYIVILTKVVSQFDQLVSLTATK